MFIKKVFIFTALFLQLGGCRARTEDTALADSAAVTNPSTSISLSEAEAFVQKAESFGFKQDLSSAFFAFLDTFEARGYKIDRNAKIEFSSTVKDVSCLDKVCGYKATLSFSNSSGARTSYVIIDLDSTIGVNSSGLNNSFAIFQFSVQEQFDRGNASSAGG